MYLFHLIIRFWRTHSLDKTIAPTPRYAYSTASTADVYATDAGAIANHLRGMSNLRDLN